MFGLFSPPKRSLDYFLIVPVGRSFCFSLLRLMPQPFSAVGFNSILWVQIEQFFKTIVLIFFFLYCLLKPNEVKKFKLSQLDGANPVNLVIVITDRLSNFKTVEYVCVYPKLYSMIETGNKLADPNSSLMKGPCTICDLRTILRTIVPTNRQSSFCYFLRGSKFKIWPYERLPKLQTSACIWEAS